MNNSLCVLTVSCDAYADVWPVHYRFFDVFWPDCTYPKFLQTNVKQCNEQGVKSIPIGIDVDWSSNLIAALAQLDYKYVLLLLEDFLFYQPIDSADIAKRLSLMQQAQAQCLRLPPKPPATKLLNSDLQIGEVSADAPFRISTQAAIWEKDYLLSCLLAGESA